MVSNILSKIRMWQWIAVAIAGLTALYFLAPQQLGVILLKAVYITVALTLGYYADRVIFYYARPHKLAAEAWRETSTHTFKEERVESAYRAYALAMIRRAIVVAAVVIAFALGL